MDKIELSTDIRSRIAAHFGKTPEEMRGMMTSISLVDELQVIAAKLRVIPVGGTVTENLTYMSNIFPTLVGLLPWIFVLAAKEEAFVELRDASKTQDMAQIEPASLKLQTMQRAQLVEQALYSLSEAGVPASLIAELRAMG